MDWTSFGWQEKTYIVILNNLMNDRDYQKIFHFLLPLSKEIGGTCFMFEQTNASIHATNSTCLSSFCSIVCTVLTGLP